VRIVDDDMRVRRDDLEAPGGGRARAMAAVATSNGTPIAQAPRSAAAAFSAKTFPMVLAPRASPTAVQVVPDQETRQPVMPRSSLPRGATSRVAVTEDTSVDGHDLAEKVEGAVAAVQYRASVGGEGQEKLRLAREVVLRVSVSVEMVVRQVRKDPDLAGPRARHSAPERLTRQLDNGYPSAVR